MINSKKYILAILCLTFLSNVSCAKKVKLIVINEDANKGFVTSGGEFVVGSNVILNARPKEGYLFTGWYSSVDGIDEALCFKEQFVYTTTDKDITIKAKWENYSTQSFAFNKSETEDAFAISSYSGADKDNVIIPSTHYGLKVNRIDANTFAGAKIDKITNLDGIEEIGDYAFERCSVKELNLPHNLKSNKVSVSICDRFSSTQKINIPKQYIRSFSLTPLETFWGWKLTKNQEDENYSCDRCGDAKLYIVD